MYIEGECKLADHPTDAKLKVVVKQFTAVKNGWSLLVLAGTCTDGASIPWPFTIWLDKYDQDYIVAAVIHDTLVGQFGAPAMVYAESGQGRVLSWKEAAVWFRAAMKADNDKLIRRVFYHAVMLWKRIT